MVALPAPDRRPLACSRRGERPHLLIPRLARLGCRLCFGVGGPHGMVGDLPCGPIGVDLPPLASPWPAPLGPRALAGLARARGDVSALTFSLLGWPDWAAGSAWEWRAHMGWLETSHVGPLGLICLSWPVSCGPRALRALARSCGRSAWRDGTDGAPFSLSSPLSLSSPWIEVGGGGRSLHGSHLG